MTPEDKLRSAGCTCKKPLVGYRPEVGPRCRLCGVTVNMNSEDQSGLPDMRHAPFSDWDVEVIREYQKGEIFHPYTCCDHQTMTMSRAGLVCPKCGALQTWIGLATFRIMERHYDK